MDLFLCVLLPFAFGLFVRKAYKGLPLLPSNQLARWIKRLEFAAKLYFGVGALAFVAGAAYLHLNDIAPQASLNLQFYSLMIGWLLGFAAIQFMRRHYHTGELQTEFERLNRVSSRNSSPTLKSRKNRKKAK